MLSITTNQNQHKLTEGNLGLFGLESFEWYDCVFITHHPKLVGPTEKFLFGYHHPYLVTRFWSSNHSKNWVMKTKKEIQYPFFQDSSPMTQWHFCNKLSQWGPFNQWLVPSIWPLELASVTLHLSENCFLKNFPLLTSLFSLPSLLHFHPHIPAR